MHDGELWICSIASHGMLAFDPTSRNADGTARLSDKMMPRRHTGAGWAGRSSTGGPSMTTDPDQSPIAPQRRLAAERRVRAIAAVHVLAGAGVILATIAWVMQVSMQPHGHNDL